MNQLILGDCLEVMKELPDECVDLIYLDPPFFSNRNYEVIWGDAGEIRSFKDCDDVWTFVREDDFRTLNSMSHERIGYPTQKPEALLERIILASSNEGDVVLDPFVGGGTTVAVADRLKRKWIGIDQSENAIKVSNQRLNKQKEII